MDAATTPSKTPSSERRGAALNNIAVGVDGFPEGNDAVVLGMALARVTNAELMLVAVHSDPLVLPPLGVKWKNLRAEAQATLQKTRTAFAPESRIVVETDMSVPRALARVVRREHHDLLVMGSSRHAPEGRVRIGKRTRQLLGHFECPLAVAPRGLHKERGVTFKRIAVGYDGGPESKAALELAASIAIGAGAQLNVHAVVDDRVPLTGQSTAKVAAQIAQWEDAVTAEMDRWRKQAQTAAEATGAKFSVEVDRGRPADALLELSEHVDLLVIGSRRWGPVERVLLGSTGETLLHDAACSVLVVPRPATQGSGLPRPPA